MHRPRSYALLRAFFKSYISHTIYPTFSLHLTARNVACNFPPFPLEKMHKKGNHSCSSLLKMTFHKHSPLLIADSKIGSHRLKVLVSRVCSNHFFCPSFFCTMHDKSSSSCVCRKYVAYPCCDVASGSSAILCFAHLPCYPQLARNLLQ